MKCKYDLCVLAVACMLTCILDLPQATGAEPAKETEDLKEPPVEFFLEYDGKKESIKSGAELNIEKNGVKFSLIIRENPYRRISKEGVSFLYPNTYTYIGDASEKDFTIFSVFGRQNKVSLTRYRMKYPLESILPNYEKGVLQERSAVKKEESQLQVQDGKLTGIKFSFLYQGLKVSQCCYAFNTVDHSYVLMIQDVLDKDDAYSKEAEHMLRLLKESLKIQEKK